MAHLREAQKLGATVHQHAQVIAVESRPDSTIVRTTGSDFRAARLVITAGPWAADVLRELALPLAVTRQQKFYFRPSNPDSLQSSVLPVYSDYDRQFYGFPLHGPGIKVADDSRGESTHPNRIDRTIDADTSELLRKWLQDLMPQQSFEYLEASTCMYTMTPDEDLLIGPHPHHEDVFVGAGFSGHGFKFSTLVGLILTQLAIDGMTPYPIDRFRLDRLTSG